MGAQQALTKKLQGKYSVRETCLMLQRTKSYNFMVRIIEEWQR